MSDPHRHQPDYDRCGWGTPWGCKEYLPEAGPGRLVCNAAQPDNANDNGHRLFHLECFEEVQVHVSPRQATTSLRLAHHG